MTKPKPKPEAPPEAPRTTRAFIDGVESGVARLLMADASGEWRTFHLPALALPAGAKEGSWIELAVRSVPPPQSEARALREHLGRSDPGGNFSL